jgi:hypothetical protein
MSKYRKKPIVIEAHQWFNTGDHPEDHAPIGIENPTQQDQDRYYDYLHSEGRVVNYYLASPHEFPGAACKHCGMTLRMHGWIKTLEGGHIVCPSDWIITGVQGEKYPCKNDIFLATYEEVEEP